MMYLNTMGSVVLKETERKREDHMRETRMLAALVAPTTRPGLRPRPEPAGRPLPVRTPRWRFALPWREQNLAEAA